MDLKRRPRWKRILRLPLTMWRIYCIAPEQSRHLRLWRAWLIGLQTVRRMS